MNTINEGIDEVIAEVDEERADEIKEINVFGDLNVTIKDYTTYLNSVLGDIIDLVSNINHTVLENPEKTFISYVVSASAKLVSGFRDEDERRDAMTSLVAILIVYLTNTKAQKELGGMVDEQLSGINDNNEEG